MNKFLLILAILFVVFFIGQQSHFIEKKSVLDDRIGVTREEYQFNWNNVTKYVNDIPNKVKSLMPRSIRR